MPISHRRRSLVAASLVFATAVVLSCDAHRAAIAATPVLRITSTDYAFDAPAQVEGGLVTIELTNRGPSLHQALLIKLAPGKTAKEFSDSLASPTMSQWVSSAGGVAAILASDVASETQILAPGNYVIVCGVPDSSGMPHMMKGMVRALTVVPSAAHDVVAGWKYDETLALNEFAFTATPAFTSGRRTIRVTNRGTMPHSAVLLRLAPGVSTAQALKWGDAQAGTPPFQTLGGIASLPPGGEASFTADLTPGTYSLICFEYDAHDHQMHFAKGMTKEFTIT